MKPAPVVPLATADEQEFYDSYANSRHLAVMRLKRRYRSLERRLQRMEHTVTSREFDWNEKLDS
jgi:phage shock protein C